MRDLSETELELVVGGVGDNWDTVNTTRGNDNVVPGGGQGLDPDLVNPGGNEPKGQNKDG